MICSLKKQLIFAFFLWTNIRRGGKEEEKKKQHQVNKEKFYEEKKRKILSIKIRRKKKFTGMSIIMLVIAIGQDEYYSKSKRERERCTSKWLNERIDRYCFKLHHHFVQVEHCFWFYQFELLWQNDWLKQHLCWVHSSTKANERERICPKSTKDVSCLLGEILQFR